MNCKLEVSTAYFAGQYVKTDATETRHAAWIMIVSSIPFVVAQVLLLLHETATVRIVTVVAFVVSVALLVSYVLLQVIKNTVYVDIFFLLMGVSLLMKKLRSQ